MQDISELLEQIRQQYIAELPSRFDSIESYVLNLDDQVTFTENFEELYRLVHSLKGSAGTHNLHILSTIAHHFENLITETGKTPPAKKSQIDQLLLYIDFLRHSLEQIINGETVFSEVEKKLLKLHSSEKTAKIRVLVLEPSKTINNIINQVLADYPVNIDVCQDGYTALRSLLMENYDLLVVNAEAPVLNGVALIAALKHAEDRKHHTLTVLLTSKELASSSNRYSDPDFTVWKNNQFIKSFAEIVNMAISKIGKRS